ncbi:o-succinylbenzoate synthase [Endozoicomonadaceae bacterium StTr2]
MFYPLAAVALFRYQLPLKAPLRLASGTIEYREGVLLQLTSSDGNVSWGEAAPLPGFSPDSIENAVVSLQALCEQWSSAGGIQCHLLSGKVEGLISACLDAPVSVQCAVDFALSRLSADQIPSKADSPCPLLTGKNIQLQSRLEQQEYHPDVVKLKVGSFAVAEDIERLNQVRDFYNGQIRFRLDANRQWTLEQALEFAAGVDGSLIDWIEEPVVDARQHISFYQTSGIGYALDENLRDFGTMATGYPLQDSPGLKAIVIKPTMSGGLDQVSDWVIKAIDAGISSIISSSFESSLMLNQLQQLHQMLGCLAPPGLDTAGVFGTDIILQQNRIQQCGGRSGSLKLTQLFNRQIPVF